MQRYSLKIVLYVISILARIIIENISSLNSTNFIIPIVLNLSRDTDIDTCSRNNIVHL